MLDRNWAATSAPGSAASVPAWSERPMAEGWMVWQKAAGWWALASLECSWAAGSWAQEMAHWRGLSMER